MLGAYVSRGGDQGDELLQHHRRQPRSPGAGLGSVRDRTDGCLKNATPMVDRRSRTAAGCCIGRTQLSTATDLADAMVREAGPSFRDAHHVAAAWCAWRWIRAGCQPDRPRRWSMTSRSRSSPAASAIGRAVRRGAWIRPRRWLHGAPRHPEPGEVRRRAAALGKALAAAAAAGGSAAPRCKRPSNACKRRCAKCLPLTLDAPVAIWLHSHSTWRPASPAPSRSSRAPPSPPVDREIPTRPRNRDLSIARHQQRPQP